MAFGAIRVSRFLYIDDFLQAFDLQHVFHLENDVMLYVNWMSFCLYLKKCYAGIATTLKAVLNAFWICLYSNSSCHV